ncbi:MAG: histone deacetylase [Chitinivibrionales bacterium]|nr:histone deacetylase [Chitinivibrionales bacterium]MBD3355777.1 histone deacetylase [Chitinivibrionales bacterium]
MRTTALGALALGFAPRVATKTHGSKSTPTPKTAYIYDKRFLEHLIQKGHPESPDRLVAIQWELRRSGVLRELDAVDLSPEPLSAIRLNHTAEHVAEISRHKASEYIARLAVAGAVAAVDAVLSGTTRNAFCALRPPGHHARNTGRPEGFCYYNNIAIAARHAQKEHGLRRILIIDWDYHHGNATEEAFYDDPSVLFFSTHDRRAYPGTGHPSRTGSGDGEGYTINVHCRCGTSDDDMYRIWEKRLLPAVDRFRPELVLISAGFDSRKEDPLGCFRLTDIGFSGLTRMAMTIAKSHCAGKLVSVLEGGYNIKGLATAATAHVQTLLDE